MKYIEIDYVDEEGYCRSTGFCVEMDTNEKTVAAFESLRAFGAPFSGVKYLADLYDAFGNLIDTIPISENTFRCITGGLAWSDRFYVNHTIRTILQAA